MTTISIAPMPSILKDTPVVIRWECPNCGQRLADVMGDRVVIKTGDRRISFPLRDGTEQTCPKCGAYSELRLIQ